MATVSDMEIQINAALVERIKELEAQIERENDLWILWPSTQEMVQLRFHRRKLQTAKVDDSEGRNHE